MRVSAWAIPVIADLRARAWLAVLTLTLGTPVISSARSLAPDAVPPNGSERAQPSLTPSDSVAVSPPPSILPTPRPYEARTQDDALRDGMGLDSIPIREIEINPLNVYEPVHAGRLSGFYRVANRLHVRTRRSTIRHQLLFKRGDRWSDARGRELARNLRSLSFLTPVRIEPILQSDSVDIQIVTRDLWTTSPEFNFESSGGKKYGSLAFAEKNFAGRGKLLSYAWRHEPRGISQYMSYSDPNVAGSRLRLGVAAGKGADGASTRVSAGVPFWSLVARYSYGVQFARVTSNAVLYESASDIASINQRVEETELWWGHSAGLDSTIRRFTYSLLMRDKRLGPTVAVPGKVVPEEFVGGEESYRIRRLNVEMRRWRPSYVERVSVDQMAVIEDLDLGSSIAFKAGYAPRWFGGQDEGYARVQVDGGADTRLGFGWVRGSISTRIRATPLETLQQIDARWYHQSFGRQTVALAAYGIAGLHMDRDFQAIVGGLNGLRAYPVQAVAGWQLWRLNGEDRWRLGSVFGDFLTFGAVGFVDAARAWGPGSDGSEWFADAGGGLRLTAPHWTLGRVLRLDLAWPINPTRDGRRQPVFSFGSSQAF